MKNQYHFQLSTCSDKQSKLNEPLCHMILRTEHKEMNFEMSSIQLDEFISNLEKIQNVNNLLLLINFKYFN